MSLNTHPVIPASSVITGQLLFLLIFKVTTSHFCDFASNIMGTLPMKIL